MTITFRKFESTVAGTIDGKPFNAPKSEAVLKIIADAQADAKSDPAAVMASLKGARNIEIAGSNEYLTFNPITKEYFLQLEGKKSSHPIPAILVKFIEDSYDKEIDFMPVVKAWARLLSNPRYSTTMANFFSTYLNTSYVDEEERTRLITEDEIAESIATEMATYQDIAITEEGLLATYKVAEIVTWKWEMILNEESGEYEKIQSKKYKAIADKIDPTTGDLLKDGEGGFEKPEHLEDFQFTPAIHKSGDKFFSGDKIGYVYEVGKMQHLPEDAKRNLSNSFGGGGLYIGGLNYVKGYRSQGTHVLTCFVNPSDILSFQSDGHAIRVDALMPNNVWDETIPLKSVYHSSDYGKVSEKRVEALIAAAIEKGVDLNDQHSSDDVD